MLPPRRLPPPLEDDRVYERLSESGLQHVCTGREMQSELSF